jgi:hypothetical protein
MPMNPRTLRPSSTFTPKSISGLALWLDGSDSSSLYTTDAGPVEAVAAPTDISGCVGWWDASDASSITESSGVISQWSDKSGLGNHATASGTAQPTLTAGGLNGRSVVTFDGTANAMTVSANAAFNTANLTYFIVFRQTSTANKGVYTKLNATAGTLGFGLVVRSDPAVWMLQKNAGVAQVLTASVNPTTQARIYSVTSSTAAAGFLDGLSTAAASGLTADHSLNQNVTIGARASSEFLNGYIAEIIHYDSALSTADRARVEAYLAAKWGISGVHAPATATSDPVGYWRDKSGNNRHAVRSIASRRPSVSATAQNGRKTIDFTSASFTGMTAPGGQSMKDGATFCGAYFSGNVNFSMLLNVGNTTGGQRWDIGSAFTRVNLSYYLGSLNPPANLNSVTCILTGVFNKASNTVTLRLNGAEIATGTASPALASYASDVIGIGMNNFDNEQHLQGRVFELAAYTQPLLASQARRIEQYLARRWGITLAPQVSNADAQDWVNRVYANGGTVSTSTASAVNTFCNDIDAAGIRDRFYRLNLFAGNSDASLNAVRTPLFRGPSRTGTQYGGTTDTNNNFVAGDYAENNGLLGNGSTKWLNTGFVAASSGLTSNQDLHISVSIAAYTQGANTSTALASMARATPDSDNDRYRINVSSNSTPTTEIIATLSQSAQTAVKQIAAANGAAIPGGLWLVSRGSATDLRLYNGATQEASSASSIGSFAPLSTEMSVFALWNGVTASQYSPARTRAYSVGLSMTAQQVSDFNTAMAALQTALGRA